MCGICGIYNLDRRPVEESLLERMNNTMVHRGPDDVGYYIGDGIGLGHRRLSIIDLDTGKQPIFNENNTKVIVFNGEIYNFQKLKKELEEKGHRFKTKTDTEVVLHGYEEWGTDCVSRLRGMFAFAIWDGEIESLFLARDRLGIKPLYYSCTSSRMVFGSELKAVIADQDVPKQLDHESVSDYLSFGYVPAPKTIFRDVKKLPPGYVLIQNRDSTSLKKYWDIHFDPEPVHDENELCNRILETLEESVRLRLISDVPLGAFLSGGIDSSLVVALMCGLMDEPVVTNSVGFMEKEFSELEHAQVTSKLFGTKHHELMVDPDAVDIVDRLAWHFDEPFADSSAIPTYYVSKMARQNVTVALSGDGGDENFAGYRRYYYDRLENQLRKIIPQFFRTHVIGPLSSVYPKADWGPQIFRAKTFLTNLSHDPVSGYFNSMSYFLPEMKQLIMSPGLKEELKGYDSKDVFRGYYDRAGTDDPLSRIQYIDFKSYLADDILTKVDRASMANSLEVRVPILDHEFVELAARISSTQKLKGKITKYIFKKSAKKLLPREILNRKKMGFSIPVGHWLRNELAPLVRETILNNKFEERQLFDSKYVRWLYKQHLSGMRDFTQPLWALLSFELWARKFL